MIGISKVSKHFDEVQALAEVNLDIATGEFISIVGPSGCGKTTLLNILGTLDKPDSGEVIFKGELVTHMNDDQLSKRFLKF